MLSSKARKIRGDVMPRGYFKCTKCGETLSSRQKRQHEKDCKGTIKPKKYTNPMLDAVIEPKSRGKKQLQSRIKTAFNTELQNAVDKGVLQVDTAKLLQKKDKRVSFEQGMLVVRVPVMGKN